MEVETPWAIDGEHSSALKENGAVSLVQSLAYLAFSMSFLSLVAPLVYLALSRRRARDGSRGLDEAEHDEVDETEGDELAHPASARSKAQPKMTKRTKEKASQKAKEKKQHPRNAPVGMAESDELTAHYI